MSRTPKGKDLFESFSVLKTPNWVNLFAKMISVFICVIILTLTFVPWQQTSQGAGQFIAFNPNDRVQNINSAVPGRIKKWFVRDGSIVKKGDPLVEIEDNDPNFLDRLKLERDAAIKKYEANQAASRVALLNYERQKELFKLGLSSELKFEKAKISYKKMLSSEAEAEASLAKSEIKVSRQKTQLIRSSRDGTILSVLHGSDSVFVSKGEVLARFVPDTNEPSVEIYVNGNDLPLIYSGRLVRLQFEGWPAVQFSGWPSIAIGTFGGVVNIVDSSVSKNGKFRVIITPEKGAQWPDRTFLRQGTRAYAWILLNSVKLGYEVWRQFNGFPVSLDSVPENIIEYQKARKTYNKKVDSDKEGDHYE